MSILTSAATRCLGRLTRDRVSAAICPGIGRARNTSPGIESAPKSGPARPLLRARRFSGTLCRHPEGAAADRSRADPVFEHVAKTRRTGERASYADQRACRRRPGPRPAKRGSRSRGSSPSRRSPRPSIARSLRMEHDAGWVALVPVHGEQAGVAGHKRGPLRVNAVGQGRSSLGLKHFRPAVTLPLHLREGGCDGRRRSDGQLRPRQSPPAGACGRTCCWAARTFHVPRAA